jgi:GNAT superfamily N-acetyltransferase
VEPVVEPVVTEPQPAVEVTPTEPVVPETPTEPATAEAKLSQIVQPKEREDLAELPEFKSFEMNVRGVPVRFDIDTTKSDENTLYLESFRVPREERRQGIGREAMTNMLRWADENNVTLKGEALTAPADRQYRTPQEMREQGYMTPRELFNFYKTLGWEADPEGPTKTMGIPMVYRPKPVTAVTPPAEVAPTPEAVTPTPENTNLEPLRRVARAEQTEEDVSGLVGQGLVELYNGQPVITQAGLEALPEAERPRLNPEARKIQIDTGSNEVVAEAIAKNLRIGVDQVGTGVRMPAGWTLVEDIYVPPKPIERIAPSEIETAPDIEESADVFASIWGKRPRIDVDKILSVARSERQKSPRNTKAEPLTPKEFLEKPIRFALKAASKFNFNPETRPSAVMFADISAILAESPIPALDDENIVSLSSMGRRGRARRFWGGDVGMASTKGMSIKTFIHEVGHSLTADQLRQYGPQMRGAKPINGKKYINQLRKLSGDNSIPQPVRNIFTMYVSTIEQLGLMDLYGSPRGLAGTPNPDVSMNRALELQREGKIPDTFTRGDFYALANIYEFVSQTFTEQSFRDKLKDLKSPIATNKSLWQEFVTAIRQILGLPNDSMAAAVIEASLDISMSVPAQRELARKRRGRGGAATPSEVILRPEFRSMPPEAYADYLESAPESERENIDIYENSAGWTVYEGREIISKLKPNSTKFRRISDKYIALPRDWDFVANVDGVPYGLTKEEDPDDENLQVWAFGKIGTNDFVETIYNVGMEQEVMDQMRQDLIEKQAEEPMAPVEEYAPRTEEEQKAFDKASSNKVLARNPQLAVAAVRMKNGEITAGEYADLVDAIDPFTAKGADPIPTKQKIQQFIAADKADQVMQPIESGKEVEFRIDIPTYNRSTAAGDPVYAVTAHEPMAADAKGVGKVISFVGVAKVNNPTFMTRAISGRGAAADIAAGAGKFPLATVKGNYDPITELPADINDPNVWTEVGYNPIRSSFFVDVRSKDAVVGGSEAIMVGSRVFVKDAVLEPRPTGVTMGELYAPPEEVPTFTEGSPEASTLSTMAASMAKVDAASEAKGPTAYKISEIASVWMDQGGDARQLQDMVVEYTNLTPANAKKVANAIAKQYGLQQGIAEAGAVIAEPAAEGEGAPRKTSVQRLIEQAVGVRRPIVRLEVNEKTALKDQIRLKAREARETRKARKEAARELAEAVTQYVKDNQIRGPVRARQTISLAKQALKLDVNNEKAVDRYIMYVERVVENANYDKDLSDAKALRKRAKQMAKNKNIGPEQKKVLEAIGNINPSLLDNPYEYNVLTERYLLGFLPVTSARYSVMPDAEARQYLESLEVQMKDNQAELDRAELERFFESRAGFAQQRGLTMEEAESLLNEDGDISIILNDFDLEKKKATEEMLLNLAQNAQKTLKTYDDTANTARQKELISFMQKVKLESITSDEKKRFIRFANNVLANGETFGVEQFEAIAKAQMASVEAAKDKRLSKKFAAWISPIAGETATEAAKGLAQYTQSEADTLKNIFGREAVGAFRKLLGLLELDRRQTLATKVKEQIANKVGQFYENLKKKYGEDAVNMEAKTYAAAAGYFIQAEGNKTQEESIAYRRRLWQENIEDLRQSERKSDRDEAELKQKALEALTGNSNAEILNSLKSLNPASYEQLMWWKDEMHPEHKEFLKEHNENFRNQADNYSENDYLSIHYKWKEYVETPSELDAQEYEDPISFRIRQSANSIKRKEHANLPVNPKTNTKANIDVNFGYNQYSALTDQIDRAYTAPAWESVWAFTRVPEFETIVGGRANANFVKNILRNIKATRSKRAMLDDENQIIGGNVALARRLATQATLGGATQPIRQVPDQLFKLFSTSGRWDIIASNIANSVINYSGVVTNNPLLDKFPISRRGDARAGSQFAAEFNELARKVEASATNKKWTKYKELMNKMGEFWMTPLRASDAWIAKVSWLSYYEAYLNRNNIKMESFEREAELAETDQVRQEAAAQAEYMVDFYAGASDPTKMAALSKQSNNGWREFAKLVFLPLNSFALQQKSALISDARDLMLREGDRKAALAGIVGNVAGMVAFHGIRIYLIGGLIYPAGMAVLKGIFGIDMDEPDEEEQDKQVRDNWRKMKASIYANIVAGGAGQFFEGLSIDAFNKTMYLWDAQINPDEILNKDGEVMSFGQYEKEMSPFYRYRSYASPEYTFGLVDVLTEQAQRSVTQTGQLLSDEEMSAYTPNEQAYAYFSTTVEWLYFFKMMDTDATRVARRLKQDMDRQVKEREAELRAIRNR